MSKDIIYYKDNVKVYKKLFNEDIIYFDLFNLNEIEYKTYPSYSDQKQNSTLTFSLEKNKLKEIVDKLKIILEKE